MKFNDGKDDVNKDMERAKRLGFLYAKHILNMDDEIKDLYKGAGFFSHFTDGMKKVLKAVPATVALAGAATGQPELVAPALALHAAVNIGSGVSNKSKLQEFIDGYKRAGGCECEEEKSGKGHKKKRAVSNKTKRRNALVKKVMKKKGMSMIEASKYIKQNNIKY